MNIKSTRNIVIALLVLVLGGCSGGTGGTGAGGGSSSAVSSGVMTKGSVIVNGVRFEDNIARIMIDDTPKTAADLLNGMVVKVRGRINDDRLNGTADEIEVENEVRGTVQSTNAGAVPASFTVLGQTVLVDDLTVFANVANVAALTAGSSVVEVHGQRDVTGNIRASRVELIGTPGANVDELRGTAVGPNGTTFTLSGVTVNYASAIITPTGAVVNDGNLVEVHGTFSGSTFIATRVDLEDLEDDRFSPGVNDDFEVEGFVTGCPAAHGVCGNTFMVNGRAVHTTSATRIENGSPSDLVNGVKVEAEGRIVSGVLEATKISFRRTQIRLFGSVTVVNASTLQLFGKPVQINSLTSVDTSDTIVTGDRVEMRGYQDRTGALIAERVEDKNNGGGDDFVQAPVELEDEGAQTLVLLGTITANLSSTPDNMFRGDDDAPLAGGRATFFAAVIPVSTAPPGTLVKVKGSFAANTNILTVTEAELEN